MTESTATPPSPEQAQQRICDVLESLAKQYDVPLAHLSKTFELSPIEEHALLLCLGMELISGMDTLCAHAQESSEKDYASFCLLRTLYPDVDPAPLVFSKSSLQQQQLIEISARHTLARSPLQLDPHILSYLSGDASLDPRLAPYIAAVPQPQTLVSLPPSYQVIVDQIVHNLTTALETPVQLCGLDAQSKRQLILAACDQLGYQVYQLSAALIPHLPADFHQLRQRWMRQAKLEPCILLLDGDNLNPSDLARDSLTLQFIEHNTTPLIISSKDRLSASRLITAIELPKLTQPEQRDLWNHHLGAVTSTLNGDIDSLVTHFSLDPQTIETICRQTLTQTDAQASSDPKPLGDTLWNLCRTQSRISLDGLTKRIEPRATWDDLLLPEATTSLLHQIVAHSRERATVYQQWKMSGHTTRGQGLAVVFYGVSGTGKTTAAEIIANDLNLDLYRIDLSQVVDKYVGETEKKLELTFAAAERSGAVLLFDEADSIFGKRSDVKEARDRYANLEVSYLLQRIEEYSGLAILTTNLINAMDNAFKRRLRFMVQFKEPDAAQRQELWQRVFPDSVPKLGLNYQALGQLGVSGAIIRAIAEGAAFLAANEKEPVMMRHIKEAAFVELVKMGLPTQIAQQWR
jgi:ATPase family associated with various cellular activities (AAA)